MEKVKYISSLVFAFSICISSFAQNERDGRLSIQAGWSADFFDEMTVEQIISRSNEYQLNAIDLNGYTFSYAYREVSAASVGFDYTLNTRNRKGMWKMGLNVVLDREPLVSYEINNVSDPDYRSVGFCIIESEVNLNLAYLRNIPISNRFSAYLGPQASFGSTFGDEFVLLEDEPTGTVIDNIPVMNHTTTYFDASSTRLYRLGVNSGVNYHFKNERWKLGLEGFIARGKQQLRNYKNQDFTSLRVLTSVSYKLR